MELGRALGAFGCLDSGFSDIAGIAVVASDEAPEAVGSSAGAIEIAAIDMRQQLTESTSHRLRPGRCGVGSDLEDAVRNFGGNGWRQQLPQPVRGESGDDDLLELVSCPRRTPLSARRAPSRG